MRRYRGFVAEWGWEEIVPTSGSEPSMNRGRALFAKDGSDFVLIGGTRENFSGNSSLSDLWTYSAASGAWTQVLSSGLTTSQSELTGFGTGSGNVYQGPNGSLFDFYSVNKSSGAETSLGAASHRGGDYWCADISGGKLYSVELVFISVSAKEFRSYRFDLTSSSASSTQLTSTSHDGQNIRSSLARYPANNTLYMFAPTLASDNTAWTLGTDDIIKYDLTANTGWVAETGVTNNAGAIGMGTATIKGSLVWVASESKFYFFAYNGQVITYDPSSKTLAQAVVDSSAPSYVIGTGKGNAGDVVVDGSDIYMIRKRADYDLRANPARIWKFRRN